MDEVLISKGNTRGRVDQYLINHPVNCVLVHHGNCHIEAETLEGKLKCLKQIITCEGILALEDWLKQMETDFPRQVAEARFLLLGTGQTRI